MTYDCIYETEDFFYLVFEPVLAMNLRDMIKANHTISKQKTKIIMEAVLSAISYLHNKNILHRDINPNNIFFRDKKLCQDNIVLGDFGISIREQDLNNNKMYVKCGTPGFIAPEIFNSNNKEKITYDKRCDLFSLGITFYYIRLGRAPYDPYDINGLKEMMEKNRKCEFTLKEYINLDYMGNLFSITFKYYFILEKYLFERLCDINPEKRGDIDDWINFDLYPSCNDITREENEFEEKDGYLLSEKMIKFKL